MSVLKHTCCGRIPWGDFGRTKACDNTAKVERDGKHYCGRHDPVVVKARIDARNAEFDAKWEAEQAKRRAQQDAFKELQRRADLYPKLLELLERWHLLFPYGGKDEQIIAIENEALDIIKQEKERL